MPKATSGPHVKIDSKLTSMLTYHNKNHHGRKGYHKLYCEYLKKEVKDYKLEQRRFQQNKHIENDHENQVRNEVEIALKLPFCGLNK